MPIPTLTSSWKLRGQTRGSVTRSQPPQGEARSESANSHSISYNAGNEQKRRDLLSQRGLPKSIFRTDASTDTPTTKQPRDTPTSAREASNEHAHSHSQQYVNHSAAQPGRARPRSLYQPRTANQDVISARDESQATRIDNKSNKPLPSGRTQRSESLRHPAVSTQPTQSTNNRSHMRTRSTTAALSKERPKSLVGPPSHNTKSTFGADSDSTTTVPRASARLEALNRSNSTKARSEVARDRIIATTELANSDALPSQVRRRDAPKEEPRKLGRPAFSTLQQHFTPRKTGKAATSTFLHPAPDAPVTHLPPEIILLQAELLQLHLLHTKSAETSRQWEFSAQKSFHAKFDEVASLYQVMREHERHGLEAKNIQALREWSQATSSPGLIRHLQVLSGPLNEVPTLLHSGGRYDELVCQFQRWMAVVEETWSSRHSSTSGGLSETGSLVGLDDGWKEENQVLARKLTSFSRDLDSLKMPAPGTSISHLVTICKQLLDGLLSELRVMQAINSEIVAKEQQWVEDRLRMIAQDVGILESSEEKEAWRF